MAWDSILACSGIATVATWLGTSRAAESLAVRVWLSLAAVNCLLEMSLPSQGATALTTGSVAQYSHMRDTKCRPPDAPVSYRDTVGDLVNDRAPSMTNRRPLVFMLVQWYWANLKIPTHRQACTAFPGAPAKTTKNPCRAKTSPRATNMQVSLLFMGTTGQVISAKMSVIASLVL